MCRCMDAQEGAVCLRKASLQVQGSGEAAGQLGASAYASELHLF